MTLLPVKWKQQMHSVYYYYYYVDNTTKRGERGGDRTLFSSSKLLFTSITTIHSKTFISFYEKLRFPFGSSKKLCMSFRLLIRHQSGVQK